MGIFAIIAGITVVSLAFLMVVGAVNCRIEEDYWARCWDGTPSTEGATEASSERYVEIVMPELRRAA